MPDADRAAGLGDRPRVAGADLSSSQRSWAHRLRPEAVWDNSRGFVAILTACSAMSWLACATSQTKPSRWQAWITSASNEPLELLVEKIEPFDVGDDGGLSRLVRGFQIGHGKGAAQAVIGDHLIHPCEALEMVPIELASFGCAERGENPSRIPAEYWTVRDVGKTRHR
jgi:hypothetical protein